MFSQLALFLSALGLGLAAQPAPEVTSMSKVRIARGITIYHNNLAMVRETRSVELSSGIVQVAFVVVAASCKPKILT